MVDVSGGQATARAIAGADLAVFDGMGHDLPRGLWVELAGAWLSVRRADAASISAHTAVTMPPFGLNGRHRKKLASS